MITAIDFDAAWGGYYATPTSEPGGFSVFRLLDFNRDAYHAAFFSEEFDALPSADVVLALTPYIGHAPIDARGLVSDGAATLVARAPLTRDDLDGYLYYLEAHGVAESDREELVARLIAFSHDTPLPLRLELDGDVLNVTERE